jgi:hypothetical protein
MALMQKATKAQLDRPGKTLLTTITRKSDAHHG